MTGNRKPATCRVDTELIVIRLLKSIPDDLARVSTASAVPAVPVSMVTRLRVGAFCLFPMPISQSLIQRGLAEKVPHPGPPYEPDAVIPGLLVQPATVRFEPAETVEEWDPDYKEMRRTVHFRLMVRFGPSTTNPMPIHP